MLLFGGNLSGAAKKSDLAQQKRSTDGVEKSGDGGKDPLDKKQRTDDQQSAVVSPRTDVLHRLTNHELRLLEELERTRFKLQAEWRHKIADLQQNGDTVVPTVEQFAQQLSLPMPSPKKPEDLKAMMRNKTLVRKSNQSRKSILKHKKSRSSGPAQGANVRVSANSLGNNNLPLLRTNLDILPVLTNSGETPFEMGLDAGSSPMQQQQQQQHVLPIFRLPTVNPTATASVLAAKEVEVLEEDRERKQASEVLGLTLEEIATLEAELNGDVGSHSSIQQQISSLSPGHSDHTLQDKKLPGLSHQSTSKKAAHQRREARWKQNSNKGKERPSKEDIQAQRSDSLRKELESALSSVQHLTRLVKDDIVFAQRICPANELRTSLYFKRWGRDKVENIFRRLLFNLQGIAFQKWNQVVAHEKQEEKLQAYLMYKGSKKLDHFLLNWSQRKVRQAWTKWWSDIAHVKAIERLALELDAIRVLQRAWRGYRGRMFASLVKKQKLFAEQTAGAIKIQRMFRGSVTRKFFRLKKLNRHRQHAAAKIQACGRGYLARQLVKQMRLARKRFKAASKIQALYRGRKARRAVAAIRRNRSVTRAALVIQRRYRGRLGRVKFIRRQIERYRGAAATKIQRITRGRIARRIMRDLKARAAQRKALENASAIKIQKVYRGHRSRLSTELKLIALREKNRWRAKAATKIQKIMRARLAKEIVSRLRQEHVVQLVVLARTWVEYWSEDTSTWFYYNQETGEAIWAPPSSGYTKADGNLVLQTGKIIPDPLDGDLSGLLRNRKKPSLFDKNQDSTANGDADEAGGDHHKDEDEDDKLCVECEEEDARRRCDQCEDVFCDACYEKLHRSSKREKHTWKAMGSLRCIECEKMKATRWCYVCQDPYCLGCFTIIHSKGNKVSHEWTDMSTFKKAAKQQQHQQMQQKQLAVKEEEDAQTYDEFMQSHEYQYVTELVAEESAPIDYSNAMAGGGGAEGEWMTLVDENSGQTYYYNSYTGESRWA